MNPYPALVLMQRMAAIFGLGLDGTMPQFLQKGGQCWIQQKYTMSQKATWPACHLEAGQQLHMRNSQRTHIAQIQVIIALYDRWDQKANVLDQVRQGLDSDVELLMAILQANENLSYGGNAMATSIPKYAISPYKGEIDDVVGINALFRTLTATVNVLPYDE